MILLLMISLHTEASVHDYKGESFSAKGNAFVFHGGSEGIYSSTLNDTSFSPSIADSFIRSFTSGFFLFCLNFLSFYVFARYFHLGISCQI
jgi:hypothetical protein